MLQEQRPQFEAPVADASQLQPERDALAAVPAALAHRCQALPLRLGPEEITVAMWNPADVVALDDIRVATNRRVKVVSAPQQLLSAYLTQHYGPPPAATRPAGESVARAPVRPESQAKTDARRLARTFVGLLLRPTIATQARFYRSMASQLHAGITLGRGLGLLADTGPAGFRPFCAYASMQLQRGKPLSEEMRNRPDLFDPATVELVHAGERSGDLEQTFVDLADHYEQEWQAFIEVVKGGALPVAESVAFMLVGIVVAGFPLSMLWGTVLGLGALAVLVRVVLRIPGISQAFDYAKSCIPISGGIARHFAAARFCRVAGALYRAGVSLSQGFRMAAEACGNPFLKGQALRGVPKMERGSSLREVLLQMSYLPPFVVEELSTGEVSGTLDDAFARCARYCSDNGHARLTVVARIAPVVLLVIYCGVAFTVLSGMLEPVREVGRMMRELTE